MRIASYLWHLAKELRSWKTTVLFRIWLSCQRSLRSWFLDNLLDIYIGLLSSLASDRIWCQRWRAWMGTFLVGRTQQVLYMGQLSIDWLDFGVSQGSVLVLLLFLLFTAQLFEVINRKAAHSHTDDTQVHLSIPASESSVCSSAVLGVHRGDRRLDAVKQTQDEHRQNPSDLDQNTPAAVKGRHQWDKTAGHGMFSTSVSNLGVILDNQLKMTDHVAALHRSCFFQLHQIHSIRQSLTSDARKTLVNAFIMRRLDYCRLL